MRKKAGANDPAFFESFTLRLPRMCVGNSIWWKDPYLVLNDDRHSYLSTSIGQGSSQATLLLDDDMGVGFFNPRDGVDLSHNEVG